MFQRRGLFSAPEKDVVSSSSSTSGGAAFDVRAIVEGGQLTSFSSPPFPQQLVSSLTLAGFQKPSEVQSRGIPIIVSGKDAIIQGQSGSGKTLAFCVGVLTRVWADTRPGNRTVGPTNGCRALVVLPTRELVKQAGQVMALVADAMGIRVLAVTGGRAIAADLNRLRAGAPPQVLLGTPGRVHDLVRKGGVSLKQVRQFVLDEADQLLELGFSQQVLRLYRGMQAGTQTVLVSATMTEEVQELSDKIMADPQRIMLEQKEVPVTSIRQYCVNVGSEEWKYDALCDLYDTLVVGSTVIFVNSRKKVEWLAREMRRGQFAVVSVHGDMPQNEREAVMAKFRAGEARVLIVTDLWARGIDVPQVSLVINFDVPVSPESYIHRIGRSGRFGRKGFAVTLVAGTTDKKALRALEKRYQVSIPPLPKKLIR